MTSTELGILIAVKQHGEIHGTAELCRIINATDKHHVFTSALLLAQYGLIGIIPGTGGNKKNGRTIYRSTGTPILECRR